MGHVGSLEFFNHCRVIRQSSQNILQTSRMFQELDAWVYIWATAGTPGALVNIDGIIKPACLWQKGKILAVDESLNKIITTNSKFSTQKVVRLCGVNNTANMFQTDHSEWWTQMNSSLSFLYCRYVVVGKEKKRRRKEQDSCQVFNVCFIMLLLLKWVQASDE